MLCSDKTKSSAVKLKHIAFHTDTLMSFFTVRATEIWDRLPGEVVESSMGILLTHLDVYL